MERSPAVQTQEEWEEEMALKILRYTHDELYIEFRFLGIALSALEPKADNRIITFATDGVILYFSKEQLLRLFKKKCSVFGQAVSPYGIALHVFPSLDWGESGTFFMGDCL